VDDVPPAPPLSPDEPPLLPPLEVEPPLALEPPCAWLPPLPGLPPLPLPPLPLLPPLPPSPVDAGEQAANHASNNPPAKPNFGDQGRSFIETSRSRAHSTSAPPIADPSGAKNPQFVLITRVAPNCPRA
jgi:hypothetical protein